MEGRPWPQSRRQSARIGHSANLIIYVVVRVGGGRQLALRVAD
jgi:hypothetical protein